jgi:hypothetical protein
VTAIPDFMALISLVMRRFSTTAEQ